MTRRPALRPDGASSREIAFTTNQLLLGRINSVGEVTLEAGQPSTLLERPYIGSQSTVLLMPQTANAAAALPGIWIVCTPGSAALHHISSSQTDRIFNFAIVGG